MNSNDWLLRVSRELADLARSADLDTSDSWRAVTLMARLLGSPTGPPPHAEMVRRLPELLGAAGIPEPHEILDAVADELDSETDPWGPLLDALLDADDTLGALALAGQDDVARDLSAHVAGLVSLYPERVQAIGVFASMRLDTVRADSQVAEAWRAVERAPAQILADALPQRIAPSSPETVRSGRSLSQVAVREVSFSLPELLHRAAAASADIGEDIVIETADAHLKAWVYQEEGLMRLEIRGLRAPARSASLVAERRADGAGLARVEASLEVAGRTAYANLGPWSGAHNMLHQLVADSGVDPADVIVRVTVTDG